MVLWLQIYVFFYKLLHLHRNNTFLIIQFPFQSYLQQCIRIGCFGDGERAEAFFHAVGVDDGVVEVVVAGIVDEAEVVELVDGSGYADAVGVAEADELLCADVRAVAADAAAEAGVGQQHGACKMMAETFNVGTLDGGLLFEGREGAAVVGIGRLGEGVDGQQQMAQLVEGGEALPLRGGTVAAVDDDDRQRAVHVGGGSIDVLVVDICLDDVYAMILQQFIDGEDGLAAYLPRPPQPAGGLVHVGVVTHFHTGQRIDERGCVHGIGMQDDVCLYSRRDAGHDLFALPGGGGTVEAEFHTANGYSGCAEVGDWHLAGPGNGLQRALGGLQEASLDLGYGHLADGCCPHALGQLVHGEASHLSCKLDLLWRYHGVRDYFGLQR